MNSRYSHLSSLGEMKTALAPLVVTIIIVLYYNAAALECKYMKHLDPQIRVTGTEFKSLILFFPQL